MSEKKYFIQISSTSLAHYFVRGCIVPTKYINNKSPDIQDYYKEGILISEKKWSTNTDCSIEVVLTKNEASNLNMISHDYLIYYSLIPISRILNIYFNLKEQADTTVHNINKGAGFVPNRLIKIEKKKHEEISKAFDIENKVNETKIDLEKTIKAFDMLMGGFAFMRIGTHDPDDRFLNYSENYIPTLSYFNKSIADDYKKHNKIISNKFISLFNDEKSELFKYKRYLNSSINFQLLEEIAKEENIKIEEKFGVIKIDNIPKTSLLYTLSILASYGVQKQKSIDNLVSDILIHKISNDKTEEVCLIFGLNIGYTALRNSYTSNQQKKNIKFELKNKLDYYIIESLFRYSSNKEISSDFDYLLNVLPQEVIPANLPFGYFSYKIFDTIVITKKKDYLEYFANFSKKLVSEISKWFPQKFFKINSNSFENYIRQELKPNISSLIRQIRTDNEEVIKNIEIEYNKKFKKLTADYEKKCTKIKSLEVLIKREKLMGNSDIIDLKNHDNSTISIEIDQPNDSMKSGTDHKEHFTYDKLMKQQKKDLQNIAKKFNLSYNKSDTKKILSEKITNINTKSDLNPGLFEKQ